MELLVLASRSSSSRFDIEIAAPSVPIHRSIGSLGCHTIRARMCKGGPGRPCPRIGTISAQDRQNLEVGISGWIFDSNQIQSRFEIESNPIDGSTRLSWPCPAKLIRSQGQLRLAASNGARESEAMDPCPPEVGIVGDARCIRFCAWHVGTYLSCEAQRMQSHPITFPVRHSACKATQSEEFGFERPVLQAHKVWGRLYEGHVVRQARSYYQMVVGERFEVDMGKQGQIDFLGVGTGAEAWEAFAQQYPVKMCDATCGTLQGPHFLIAEIGLTSATLKKKVKDNARSLKLLQGFVSSLNATGIGAVKCLVYDGADAEDFAESEEGKQFMDEGGILMNIPYLTAETVLAKLDEPAKLREEIGKLGEEIGKLREEIGKLSGTTGAQQTQAFWVQQLCKDDKGGFELVGSAIKITGGVADIYDLKKAIEKEEKLSIAPSKIEIFSRQEDGNWSKEETTSESLRDNDEATPYGYTVP